MRIAIVDHLGNPGGGSRFVRSLLFGMRQCRPEINLVYFGNPQSIAREEMLKDFAPIQVEVRELASVQSNSPESVREEIESSIKGFDIAFFPWPYMIQFPTLDCPVVAVFHDFNFKYFFGTYIFSGTQQKMLNQLFDDWIKNSIPVTSSNFMAAEMLKFYPSCAERVSVIHVAPFSTVSDISVLESQRIVQKLGVSEPYILYPTQLTVHKNIGPLLSAVAILWDMNLPVSLVLTGYGTESLTGRACSYGMERWALNPNVFGLGYVTHDQMDALIQCSQVVVSTSLYEAGNGPGLDAWTRGVPVAMSDIPSFTEHIKVLGVNAQIFDPRNPKDIAEKIAVILKKPEEAKRIAQESKQSIQQYTWKHAAKHYLDLFDKVLGE